jgi:replicative DNA helicase
MTRATAIAADLRPANEDTGPPVAACAIEAEQAVLGALMCDAETVFALPDLRADHFFEPFHGRLFEAIRDNALKGRSAAPSLIFPRFADDPAAMDLGGLGYLADLVNYAPPGANAPDYGQAILGAFTRRELIRLGAEIGLLGADPTQDAADLTAEAERLVSQVTDATGQAEGFTSAGVVVRDAIDHARERSGVIRYPTGLRELDAMLGGLNAGEATLLGARPGTGKTVGATTVAKACASIGLGVCLFSLEMSKDALGLRIASDVAYDRKAVLFSGVSTNPTAHKATQNDLSEDQWSRLREAQALVEGWPLLIDDRPGLTLAKIEAAARRAHRRWARRGIAPGPVIIDHLGKVRPPIDRKGAKHAEMADVSAGVSEMAKRLGVPVLGLVQLNRGVEGREDKRPILSDLRQAGELEEDARQVVFLYRPEMYQRDPVSGETFEAETKRLEELARVRNELFWIVEKNSHGPRGQVQSFCDIASAAVRDWQA